MEFHTDNSNAAVLFVERVKGFILKNVIISGPGPSIPQGDGALKAVVEYTETQWLTSTVDGSLLRNNRYSPQAGIAIDAMASPVASANRYPGMSAFYGDASIGGSSNVTMENVVFRNLNVAVANGLSGHTQNGDNVKAENVHWYNCKTAWAVGGLNARANHISNSWSYFIQRFIDCRTYGQQLGAAPNVEHLSGNVIKELYSANTPHSSITFSQSYLELLYRLGSNDDVNPVNFKDVTIKLAGSEHGVYAASTIASGGPLSIDGGFIGYTYGYNGGLPFNTTNLSLANLTLSAGTPYLVRQYGYDAISFNNVSIDKRAGAYSATGTIDEARTQNGHAFANFIGSAAHVPAIPGMVLNSDVGTSKFRYEFNGTKIERTLLIGGTTLTVNTSNNTAYFVNAAYPERFRQGDNLVTSTSINGVTWGNIGTVQSISGDTIKLTEIPNNINGATSYPIYIIRIPQVLPRVIGDFETGSNIITNVKGDELNFEFPQPGDYIQSAGNLSGGARVIASSEADNTITVSRNAIATATRQEIYDAKYKITVQASTTNITGVFFKQDEIINTVDAAAGTPYKWTCYAPGLTGDATYPALWASSQIDNAIRSATTNNYTGRAVYPFNNSNSGVQVGNWHLQSRDSASGYLFKGAYFNGTNFVYTHANLEPFRLFSGAGGVWGVSTAATGTPGGSITWSSKVYGLADGTIAFGGSITNTAGTLSGFYIGANSTGVVTIPDLAGTGTRMVVASSTGVLSTQAIPSGGGGSGTVTSFSAGDLSPLFTTSEATATTTPALTFSLTSQTANRFFAAPNGSNGAPTFRVIDVADLPTIPGTKLQDGTVTIGKLNVTGTASSSTFLRGDGSWATAPGATLANGEQDGLLDNGLYSYLFDANEVTDPTSPLSIDGNVQGQVRITLTTAGGKTLALTNVEDRAIKIKFENTHSSSIVITLPANSYVRNSSGVFVSAASITVPVGLTLVSMVDYDGFDYMWTTSF